MSGDCEEQVRSLSLRVDSLERLIDWLIGGRTKVERQQTFVVQNYTVKCPSCGAPAGDPCMTSSNKPTHPHLDRIKAVTRSLMQSARQEKKRVSFLPVNEEDERIVEDMVRKAKQGKVEERRALPRREET